MPRYTITLDTVMNMSEIKSLLRHYHLEAIEIQETPIIFPMNLIVGGELIDSVDVTDAVNIEGAKLSAAKYFRNNAPYTLYDELNEPVLLKDNQIHLDHIQLDK